MSLPQDIFPFEKVESSIAPDRSQVIQWTLQRKFRTPNNIVGFHVEFSRGGEWTRITTVLIDSCLFVDTDSYRCAFRNDVYYRVVAVDTEDKEYISKPVNIFHIWETKHQYLIARDIIRQEYVRLTKLPVGTYGTLLKQRQHGTPCPICLDYDTEEVVASCCQTCYGTGFVGGYYSGKPFYMDLTVTGSKETKTAETGVVNSKNRSARAVAFPLVAEDDIWVASRSNKRYTVISWNNAAESLTIPLILKVDLTELPERHRAYEVPLVAPDLPVNDTSGTFLSGITRKAVW